MRSTISFSVFLQLSALCSANFDRLHLKNRLPQWRQAGLRLRLPWIHGSHNRVQVIEYKKGQPRLYLPDYKVLEEAKLFAGPAEATQLPAAFTPTIMKTGLLEFRQRARAMSTPRLKLTYLCLAQHWRRVSETAIMNWKIELVRKSALHCLTKCLNISCVSPPSSPDSLHSEGSPPSPASKKRIAQVPAEKVGRAYETRC